MADQKMKAACKLIDAVIAASREFGSDSAVVAVDRGGHVLAAKRQDLAGYPTFDAARKKAATSAVLGLPTKMVAGFTSADQLAARALHSHDDMLAVPGGAPIILNGRVVGGIGVSGGHYSEDQEILDRALVAAKAEKLPQQEG